MIRYDFNRKAVLVTGASRGIGATILRAFGEAGATCLLHYFEDEEGTNRKEVEALAAELRGRTEPPEVHLFAADIRSRDQVEAMMRAIHDAVGGFDILVTTRVFSVIAVSAR